MIRNALMAIVIIGVGAGLVFSIITGNKTPYEREQEVKTNIQEVEVTPEWATDEDAVKAAQDVMRKKALTQDINALDGEISTLTATYQAQLAELKKQKTEKEKELGSY